MRKLELESLNVESFDTTATPSFPRGTVRGNEDSGASVCRLCQISDLDPTCQTEDPEACGPTNYLDCTLACSDFPSCLAC
jgi:hypothetical protein